MCRTTHAIAALVAGVASAAAPVRAADLAPLPDGFRTETSSAPVAGVYAYAVAYGETYDPRDPLLAAEKSCAERGRQLHYGADPSLGTTTRYWLYRAGDETVVFEASYSRQIDVERCQVSFEEKRQVSRKKLAAGVWPGPFAGGRPCFLLASSCRREEKFGVEQRCQAESDGFSGSRHCVSVARGPARGLLIESGYWSDDMSGAGFVIKELEVDAFLDAATFDPGHAW